MAKKSVKCRGLGTARYMAFKCPHCKERFNFDNGPKYERHEYIRRVYGYDDIQCPLCLGDIPVEDEWAYSIVRN